jgi:hypothetical protein
MTQTIHLAWEPLTWQERFRTGVSLHSHTLHSRESLSFLDSVARSSTLLSAVLSSARRRYRKAKGHDLDLNRGWWTPPLAARGAWDVEAGQLRALGLRPIVSLTDHDDIEAPMALQLLPQRAAAPVSVEWSVPWRGAVLHIGVHNLPPARARALFSTMSAITAEPDEALIRDMIHALSAYSATLIVLNHPLWDEAKIGKAIHLAAARSFLRTMGEDIHALELNGLRPWRENRDVITFADEFRKPLISGGDRHGFEPNANLNLTNAETFAEFADEVREGASDVSSCRNTARTTLPASSTTSSISSARRKITLAAGGSGATVPSSSAMMASLARSPKSSATICPRRSPSSAACSGPPAIRRCGASFVVPREVNRNLPDAGAPRRVLH